MIYELLSRGKDNCITGKQLCDMTGLKLRTLTQQIEKERREGKPICASSEYPDKHGYYIASSQEELEDYCGRLKHRAVELFKTRQQCLKAIGQLERETPADEIEQELFNELES